MGKKVEMIGRRFGRWTVVSECSERAGHGAIVYLCRCDCGKEKAVNGTILRQGQSTSCGCYNHEIITKNGNTVYKEKLYGVWLSMKQRCNNPNDKAYKNYGGRGIRVCDEWANSYLAFKEWSLANGYKRGLWLDRADNDKSYNPTNCRWATTAEQSRNKRSSRMVQYNGKEMCITDAAELSGIPVATLTRRLALGWSAEDLYRPVDKKYSHSEKIRAAMRSQRKTV